MAQLTLLDLAKLRGNDAVVGLIEENRLVAPEVNLIPARTITGFSYRTVTRKKIGTQAKFLNVNEAYPTSKDQFEQNLVQCYLVGHLVKVAKAMLQVSGDAIESLQSLEASRVLRDSLLTIGKQTFYGTANDGKGFAGLSQAVAAAQDIDATGTTANQKSSVYAVKYGVQDVSYVYGGNNSFALSEFREQVLDDVPSFVADMSAWVGLQVGNIYSVGRIKNLTAETGKGLTDKLVAQLLKTMPIGNRPDVLFMGRDAAFQLQSSRSSTVNATGNKQSDGREVWAPYPTESNGIPIVVTDSLTGTEA
jgi:hypothetical protein